MIGITEEDLELFFELYHNIKGNVSYTQKVKKRNELLNKIFNKINIVKKDDYLETVIHTLDATLITQDKQFYNHYLNNTGRSIWYDHHDWYGVYRSIKLIEKLYYEKKRNEIK